jgi:hypothetical protein
VPDLIGEAADRAIGRRCTRRFTAAAHWRADDRRHIALRVSAASVDGCFDARFDLGEKLEKCVFASCVVIVS